LGGEVYNQEKLDPAERIPYISPLNYKANFENFLKSVEPQQPFFFWYGILEPHAPFAPDNWKRLESEFGISVSDISVPQAMKDTKANREMRANMAYELCYADRRLGE